VIVYDGELVSKVVEAECCDTAWIAAIPELGRAIDEPTGWETEVPYQGPMIFMGEECQ
jgi:hypothetical protein